MTVAPAKGDVLCVGRLYCDLIFTGAPRLPTPGTEVFASGLSLHAGGGAFISAATFAALGHRAALQSMLPAAPFDTMVAQEVSAFSVDTAQCAPAPAGTDPQVTVSVTAGCDRAFLTRAAGPALPSLAAKQFKGFRHLHIGELGTLQEHPDLIDHARAAGLTISLDCGWQDAFSPDVASLIAAVDVFLPNEAEAAALAAIGLPAACAPLTVVKCGEKGARACKRDSGHWVTVPTRPVAVVDATGAGDVFNSGFVSAWMRGEPLTQCLANGNFCGSTAVQATGGTGGLVRLAASMNKMPAEFT